MSYSPQNTQHVTLANANLGKGSTAPNQVTSDGYNGWEFNIGDDSVLTHEFVHDIDFTKDIGVHLVWFINEAYATHSGEVQWQADYSITSFLNNEAINNPGSSGTLTSGDINIPATAKTLVHTTNLVIPAASIEEYDVLGLTISRIALTGGNNPTADPVIISVHLEYTPKNT